MFHCKLKACRVAGQVTTQFRILADESPSTSCISFGPCVHILYVFASSAVESVDLVPAYRCRQWVFSLNMQNTKMLSDHPLGVVSPVSARQPHSRTFVCMCQCPIYAVYRKIRVLHRFDCVETGVSFDLNPSKARILLWRGNRIFWIIGLGRSAFRHFK